MKVKALAVVLAGMMLSMAGCAKKIDTSKPIEQIQTEVQKMSVGDLQSTAKAYADAIQGKKSEIETVQKQLSSLSPKDLFGEKAGGIKDQLSKIGNEMNELSKRYEIYVQKFRELGGDISKVQV